MWSDEVLLKQPGRFLYFGTLTQNLISWSLPLFSPKKVFRFGLNLRSSEESWAQRSPVLFLARSLNSQMMKSSNCTFLLKLKLFLHFSVF